MHRLKFLQKSQSIALVLFSLSSVNISYAPLAQAENYNLEIRRVKIQETQVEGTRGPALASLADGRLLLAGGLRGDTLFVFDNGKTSELGKIARQSERRRDGRFGPTDIAILKEASDETEILISYPQLNKEKSCVRLVVNQYLIDWLDGDVKRLGRWFLGKPCVPVTAVQHAAGRMEIIDAKSVYLTTGDLGFSRIADSSRRGWLGGVFIVSKDKVEQISSGHRNPQGIVLVGKNLYISEHGPRGGDELNLVRKGADYGWPLVTYGQAYGPGDYVKPKYPGTHEGFEKPLHYWVPSVAPTELAQLPTNSQWGSLGGQLIMGTLAEESLLSIELLGTKKIGGIEIYPTGERIRDLEINSEGQVVATTDSGLLLFISKH